MPLSFAEELRLLKHNGGGPNKFASASQRQRAALCQPIVLQMWVSSCRTGYNSHFWAHCPASLLTNQGRRHVTGFERRNIPFATKCGPMQLRFVLALEQLMCICKDGLT